MTQKQMIKNFANQYSTWENNPHLSIKRIIKAVQWTYKYSNINSMTELIDSISYSELSPHDMEDSYDTLYIKIKMTRDSYSIYICVPRNILNRKAEKKFFPDRFISIDSRKIIIY